ncbi:MAG: transporter [Gammaproteobacteria bacterium]
MNHRITRIYAVLLVAAGLGLQTFARADDNSDLAQKLTNPIASLISVPIQVNYDDNYGADDEGTRTTVNIQPVIPFEFNDDWNLITRTIAPLIYQDDIIPGEGSQSGLGDINMSLFFSPKKPSESGIIWGVGPVFVLPTATDDLIGSEKWSVGPAAVALTVRGPWTVGGLVNHVWSVAGDDDRDDISNTFVQPFASYTWPSAWTASIQSESNYNWETEKWSVPVNLGLSKLVRFGKLPVSLQGGVGYWAESPDGGPEDLRFRLAATLVLPKSR